MLACLCESSVTSLYHKEKSQSLEDPNIKTKPASHGESVTGGYGRSTCQYKMLAISLEPLREPADT